MKRPAFPRPALPGLAALAALSLLAGCIQVIPPGHPPAPAPVPARPGYAPGVTALTVGVHPGPDIATLGLTAANAGPALVAFREACAKIPLRHDNTGLTQPEDWAAPCLVARSWPVEDAANFFIVHFETAVVGDAATYVTGYYEPEIAGSRTRQPGYDTPVYGVPQDLVHAHPGDAPPKSNGDMPFGHYDATGHFTPYYARAEIEDGALAGRGLEIAWAADPIELYFLQVQGSGRLRGPDGSVMRIGYAADNGHDYAAIGARMREQNLIGTAPGQYPGSMQGVMQYLRDHPVEGRALMRQNQSWVFFREITGDGPIGALNTPVRAHVSLAADPAFTPLGAPVWLVLDPSLAGATIASGLWVAADTGGAIKGANRYDTFWGTGEDARRIAGGLIGHGTSVILLPKGVLAKHGIQ